MKHISRNILLSIGVLTPAISSPAMMLTSCSTTWGYNTPIQMGTAITGATHDPFANHRTGTYLDNNGNNIAEYLQSNYTIDVRTSSNYAYSNPVTKWTYTTEETPIGATSQVMPITQWERNNLGWKTSSSTDFSNNSSFSGKLKDDKYVTWLNNENVIQAANIDFTANIATSLSSYLAGAIKYQASQMANDKDINIAWGNGANFEGAIKRTLDKGQNVASGPEADKNQLFYEYVYAQANAHVSHKNHGAFLRTTSVNYNFDQNFFPIPSYAFNGNVRVDISEATKKLLMGPAATIDTKFCEAGVTTPTTLPAYFTSKTDGTQELTIGDKTDGSKTTPVNVKLSYTDYTFENVPVIITLKDLTQRWINPTKNDSIQVKDYYINDKDTIDNQVGKLSIDKKYSQHDGDIKNKEYVFTTNSNSSSNLKATVLGTEFESAARVDKRLLLPADNKIEGNKFIALVTYTVREFNNDKFLYKDQGRTQPTDYLTNLVTSWKSVDDHSGWTQDDVVAWLRQRNLTSLSSSVNIFPAYILNIYKDLFKKAYVNAKDTTIKETGYIIDASKIATHTNALLGIFTRSTTEGYKASASDLSQDSKNLLAFLTYMFGNTTSLTSSIDFSADVVTPVKFQ